MQLNLSDPDSIVQWWRVLPERHWSYLQMFESRSPQFRHEIRAARRRIQADPLYSRSRIEAFDAALQAAWAQAEQAEQAEMQPQAEDEEAFA